MAIEFGSSDRIGKDMMGDVPPVKTSDQIYDEFISKFGSILAKKDGPTDTDYEQLMQLLGDFNKLGGTNSLPESKQAEANTIISDLKSVKSATEFKEMITKQLAAEAVERVSTSEKDVIKNKATIAILGELLLGVNDKFAKKTNDLGQEALLAKRLSEVSTNIVNLVNKRSVGQSGDISTTDLSKQEAELKKPIIADVNITEEDAANFTKYANDIKDIIKQLRALAASDPKTQESANSTIAGAQKVLDSINASFQEVARPASVQQYLDGQVSALDKDIAAVQKELDEAKLQNKTERDEFKKTVAGIPGYENSTPLPKNTISDEGYINSQSEVIQNSDNLITAAQTKLNGLNAQKSILTTEQNNITTNGKPSKAFMDEYLEPAIKLITNDDFHRDVTDLAMLTNSFSKDMQDEVAVSVKEFSQITDVLKSAIDQLEKALEKLLSGLGH